MFGVAACGMNMQPYCSFRSAAASAAADKADSIFAVLRFVVGEEERRISRPPPLHGSASSGSPADSPADTTDDSIASDPHDMHALADMYDLPALPPAGDRGRTSTTAALRRLAAVRRTVAAYTRLLQLAREAAPAHRTCPHRDGCAEYAVGRAARLFGVGVGIQVSVGVDAGGGGGLVKRDREISHIYKNRMYANTALLKSNECFFLFMQQRIIIRCYRNFQKYSNVQTNKISYYI